MYASNVGANVESTDSAYAMREVLCSDDGVQDHQKAYARSLSLAQHWDATGGKSGALAA